MAFGRLGKNSNRSQHSLPAVEAAAPAAASERDRQRGDTRAAQPSPAAANAASHSGFSSRESLNTASQQQGHELEGQGDPGPPQPPPHHLKPGSGTASAPAPPPGQSAAAPASFDPRQRPLDLSPPASHQPPGQGQGPGHNLNHNHPPPLQTRTQFAADDDAALAISSPVQTQSPAHGRHQHPPPHAHQGRPPQPPEPKRSTRKLIKNILTGSSSSRDTATPQPSHDNTAGLARRPSKRASHAPNNYRYSLSQVPHAPPAADHDPAADWQHAHSPHHPHTQQSSPLPGVGEIDEDFHARHPHGLPDPPPPASIRRVATDIDAYSAYREHVPLQQQLHLQGTPQQVVPEFQLQPGSPPLANIEPHQQQQRPYAKPPPQGQYRTILPQLHTGYSQSFETSSQISRESPVADSLTSSSQLQSSQISASPAAAPASSLESPLPPLPADAQQQDPDQTMPPPSGGSSSRRSQEADKAMRAQEGQAGPPPGYRHGPPGGSQSNPALRAAGQDRPAYDGQDQGRNSPLPEREDPEKAFKELLTKYKNVKRLYFENKAQIEQMTGQIEHLQNAVANQRISASRTALDDSEYSTRFNRLNGAINNMAFNIRKDWRLVPRWLDRYVSQDALKTGKQEMTAVGRAVITRWIVEEVFTACFHPSLDPALSRRLKEIEAGIRRGSYTLTSQEEYDALTSKVISWRMATLEGLVGELGSPTADEVRAEFTRGATDSLLATLGQYLSDPLPAGVDGSASMIMELAVGIAANMPLESRDVVIRYPLPGDAVDLNFMEVEKGGLPPLEAGEEDKGEESSEKKGEKGNDANRVRLAGFVALEVSGRQVLMKAPIWTLS